MRNITARRFKEDVPALEQAEYEDKSSDLQDKLKELKAETNEIVKCRKDHTYATKNKYTYAFYSDTALTRNETAKLKIRYELTKLWWKNYYPTEEVPEYETLYYKQLNPPKKKEKESATEKLAA